jgi:hypothetical protein
MTRPRYVWPAAVALFWSGLGAAQESGRSGDLPAVAPALFPSNTVLTLFDRSRNTFNWAGRIALDTSAWGTGVRFNELYTTNIILLEGSTDAPGQRLKSSQHTLGLALNHPLSRMFDLIAEHSSLIYTDDKAVGLSSTSTHTVAGGFSWTPLTGIDVTPMAGYRWDDQGRLRDHGTHLAFAGDVRNLMLDGYRVGADLRLQEDRLSPRLLENHGGHASIGRTFEGRTRDSLDLGIAVTRREFYAPSDTLRGIDSRSEQIFTFANVLDYDIDPRLLATLAVGVYTRGLHRDTRGAGTLPALPVFGSAIDEFRLETSAQATYGEPGELSGFLRLQYGERTENHEARAPATASADVLQQFDERNAQEQTKNTSTRRTAVSGSVSWPAGVSDTLAVAGSASILRYDTPSSENTEDRDEQLFALTLTTSHRIARTLLLTVALEGTMSHTVYLLGARSANNNRNRILRLSPGTVFRPSSAFLTANVFEVLANYTVYDFEEESALVKSFSYRQFAWHDSTAVELTDRLGLDFLGTLKFYERGQLNWGEFTERTENAYTERLLSLQARWSPAAGTMFAIGYRAFTQWRYSFVGREKSLDAVLRSIGPTCAILWTAHAGGTVGLQGWYERWSQGDGPARSLANLSLNVQFTF